jgi:hypothetical protein
MSLMEETETHPDELLRRHQSADWGDVDEHDSEVNFRAVEHGMRILSVYRVGDSREVIWVITEADRSVTTILLPEEY